MVPWELNGRDSIVDDPNNRRSTCVLGGVSSAWALVTFVMAHEAAPSLNSPRVSIE